MKVSAIIPVGNMDQWRVCEKSINESVAAAGDGLAFEVLPCFDLEHKGAYKARNEGLSRATGDWIAWIDCDDLVEVNWLGEIKEAITMHPEVDVIQFDATEVKRGRTRPLSYRYKGLVSGDTFARELLRNDGMPAWLWTRVFERELFEGFSFEGRVKQDYEMFLKLLPRIHSVWSIGKPLYRYVRHGHGLSNYVQQMDYLAAGRSFENHIERLPLKWQLDAQIGLALTMADVAVHSCGRNGSPYWVRKNLWLVLRDRSVPLRLKVKCLIAALKR